MTMRIAAPFVALVFASLPAAAEDLYDQDGVQLWTSARLVGRDTATCRVLEDRHTEDVYEEMKANEGKSLHIWRLELVAGNYSGKVLDDLRASVQVESEWPPCTTWDNRNGQYTHWADTILSFQRGRAGVQAGEEVRETVHLLVFDGQEPTFGRWNIEYEFAAASPPAAERTGVRVPVPGARTSSDRGSSTPGVASAERPEPAEPSGWRPGDTFSDPLSSGGTGPEMVVIPAGSFRMGCVSGVDCRESELPVHEVTIPAALAVGKYEVTFAEWDACVSSGGCGDAPFDFDEGRAQRPVSGVDWEEAQEYVDWLSSQTSAEYRLLSESEWEYVARAGTATAYTWGNEIGSSRASCLGCGSRWDGESPAPVGSFSPNAFGLYDVHGNVREWVEDCWNDGYRSAPPDGSAWLSGDCGRRVTRGGVYDLNRLAARSASRTGYDVDLDFRGFGFRVARALTP